MRNKILHVMMAEKFMSPFIDVINNNFNREEHKMLVINISNIECPLDLKKQDGVIWITKKYELLKLSYLLNNSNKIILHGLFLNSLIISLFFQPWLMKKCCWVMWGGDFYLPEKQRWFKKRVIKKIRNFVTYLKGDFELVKKWYGAEGECHECFMYPSNLYKEFSIIPKKDSATHIQLGNSADLSNDHIEILEKLRDYKDKNIKIYAPLSYGDQGHVEAVILKGKEIFGDKFIALTDFMPFEGYLDFLGTIDIAIFAHRRQQAMGNIITLLGLGKKIYIRNDISTWNFFKDINVKVFDYNDLDLSLIDNTVKLGNKNRIKTYFSETNYLNQLKICFN
tara:strand:- start:165 stop:1175 length:1011 start_codon:yes stop_codon:yes gene_type:complete